MRGRDATAQATPGNQPSRPLPSWSADTAPGLLLTDESYKPFYINDAAIRILNFPNESHLAIIVQERIRSIFQAADFGTERWPPSTPFISGRRRYICRPFLLKSLGGQGHLTHRLTVGLLLERERAPLEIVQAGQRFCLSARERQTVQHLIYGLTTKEVAQRMNISPNTVKQYVRLVMSKMGVTTRSGIVGKILSA